MKLSILINTCDAYSDVWPPFFRILEKVWPEAAKYDIYINTETKNYSDSFFNVKVLNCINDPKNTPWGTRLLQALDRIDSEFVFFMLEDFFFEERIDNDEVEKCLRYMEENPMAATMTFTSQMECANKEYCMAHVKPKCPEFILRKQCVRYKVVAGPSIWRKQALIKYTFKTDTPWGWEFFGSKRTWFTKDEFYGRSINAKPQFVYDITHGGAVHRGKWTADSVRRVIEKYELDLDLTIRGVEEEKDFNPLGTKPSPVCKRLGSILENRAKSFVSIIYGILH